MLKKDFLSLLVFFIALPAAGYCMEEEPSGFSGQIMLGGLWLSGEPSQEEVWDDNELVKGLNQQADDETQWYPLVMGHLSYFIEGTGTRLILGADEMIGGAGLGVEQSLGDMGLLRITGSFGEEDVWKDPYLTGRKRDETDQETIGFLVEYEEILGTGAFVSFGYKGIEVDQDISGRNHPDLRRDGDRLDFGAGYQMQLDDQNALVFGVSYLVEDRDGESYSGDGYAVSLAHSFAAGRFSFETSGEYGTIDYDRIHPIFNKTREEDSYSISETISYHELFGVENLSLIGIISYSKVDANIAFFDSSTWVLGMGVGYSF